MSQCGDYLTFDRYRMPFHFSVKGFAQYNDISRCGPLQRQVFVMTEPELYSVEKVKPSRINQKLAIQAPVGPEEDRGAEDPLEALDQAAIMRPVLREVEKIQHLGGAGKIHYTVFLADSKGGNPDRD
jgi:hypothetical protein